MIKALALAAAALTLDACSGGAAKLPSDKLDAAIGAAIGDPTTCVVIADRATGKSLYRYGESFNCLRAMAACDRPGTLNAMRALALAATPGGRGASCASNAEASRGVSWAEGVVAGANPPLIYSAVMEGQAALPGIEMNTRLARAFAAAGVAPPAGH